MQDRGVKRGAGQSGRKAGSAAAYSKHHKPLEAPTLRRDPTAHEKLRIVGLWEAECRAQGVEKIVHHLSSSLLVERGWAFEA